MTKQDEAIEVMYEIDEDYVLFCIPFIPNK